MSPWRIMHENCNESQMEPSPAAGTSPLKRSPAEMKPPTMPAQKIKISPGAIHNALDKCR